MTDIAGRARHTSRPPTIRPARQGPPLKVRLPPTPRQDDGNEWVTGRCWLWCGRKRTRVLWLGPATVAGTTAGLYGCEVCVASLADQIITDRMGLDLEWGLNRFAVETPARAPTGRHRRVT